MHDYTVYVCLYIQYTYIHTVYTYTYICINIHIFTQFIVDLCCVDVPSQCDQFTSLSVTSALMDS